MSNPRSAARPGRVIVVTAGWTTSHYSCWFIRFDAVRRADLGVGPEAEGTGGPVLFCGQKPYATWPQEAPATEESAPLPPAKEPAVAEENGLASRPRRSLVLPVAFGAGLGLAALVLVGLLIAPP